MKWTIVRPTLAYNESGGEEFNMFLDYLKKYPVRAFYWGGPIAEAAGALR